MSTEDHYIISGAKIFDGKNFIEDKVVVIRGGIIEDVLDARLAPSIKNISMEGLILSAGFIDLQINGCGGVLYNDDISEKTLETMHQTNIKYGCTSFLPTLITTTDDNIKKAVEVAKSFNKKNPNSVIGIHIEGPYISKIKKGAHNPVYIKPITEDMVNFLCDSVQDIPIKITMAPEENNLDLIKRLVLAGVKVSIGHSNAKYSEAIAGIDNGISLATHLFNAMSALEGRALGVVGAVLDSSQVYAGIIVDGYHVDYNAINLVKKIKQEKLYIVTDAVTSMGTDMKEFYLADQKVLVKDGACINESGSLAGAHIDMMSSIKNAVEHVGISLQESLRMASLYPARAMGIDLRIGQLQKGFVANIVIFNANYEVKCTICDGKAVYSR